MTTNALPTKKVPPIVVSDLGCVSPRTDRNCGKEKEKGTKEKGKKEKEKGKKEKGKTQKQKEREEMIVKKRGETVEINLLVSQGPLYFSSMIKLHHATASHTEYITSLIRRR